MSCGRISDVLCGINFVAKDKTHKSPKNKGESILAMTRGSLFTLLPPRQKRGVPDIIRFSPSNWITSYIFEGIISRGFPRTIQEPIQAGPQYAPAIHAQNIQLTANGGEHFPAPLLSNGSGSIRNFWPRLPPHIAEYAGYSRYMRQAEPHWPNAFRSSWADRGPIFTALETFIKVNLYLT